MSIWAGVSDLRIKMIEIGCAWSVRFALANGSGNHFHIVMSRILSPERLILWANKPFRPGVKLSVTPEPSHSPLGLGYYYNAPSVGLRISIGKRQKGRRTREKKRRKQRLGPKQELIAVNWPEKRPSQFETPTKYLYTWYYYIA